MLDANDIASFFVGFVLMAVGILPILNQFGIGPAFFALDFLHIDILIWVLAVMALYLVYDSIQEITNSSSIGWMSILLAFVVLAFGIIQILGNFGIGPGFFAFRLPIMLYYIIMFVEGLFIFIAGFAMEM